MWRLKQQHLTLHYVETETAALVPSVCGDLNSSTRHYIMWRLKLQHLTVHYVETERAALDTSICGD